MSDVPVVLLRRSEVKLFKTCRWAWARSYMDRLTAIQVSPALRFGDLVHQALACWYVPGRKRGEHPAEAFERIYDEAIEAGLRDFDIRLDEDEKWHDARQLGIDMLNGYVAHWGTDKHLKVIASEMPAQVDVMSRQGKYMCTFVLQFDIVVVDMERDQCGLLETKTAASIRTGHLGLDEQAGSYWAFAGEHLRNIKVLKPGQDISFIQYNFLRKGLPDERPRNELGHYLNKPSKPVLRAKVDELGLTVAKSATVEVLAQALGATGIDVSQLGEVSKNQPPPLFVRQKVYRDQADRDNIMFRIRAVAAEIAMVRAGKLPIYKNPGGQWPNEQCSACEFKDVCLVHEGGGDHEELIRLTMTEWDPYQAHRESMPEQEV